MTFDPNAPSRIDQLPAELRIRIFEYIVEDEGFTVHAKSVTVPKDPNTASNAAAQKHRMYAAKHAFTVTGRKYYMAFSSVETRAAYREALQNYIIEEAPVIRAIVVDYKLGNLTKLLKMIKKALKDLHEFSKVNGRSTRRLELHHSTTHGLSADAKEILAFNKLCGPRVSCSQKIIECQDIEALKGLASALSPATNDDDDNQPVLFLDETHTKMQECIGNFVEGERRRHFFAEDDAIAVRDADLDAEMYHPSALPAGYSDYVEEFGSRWQDMYQRLEGSEEQEDGEDEAVEDEDAREGDEEGPEVAYFQPSIRAFDNDANAVGGAEIDMDDVGVEGEEMEIDEQEGQGEATFWTNAPSWPTAIPGQAFGGGWGGLLMAPQQ